MSAYPFHRLTRAGMEERGLLRLSGADPVMAMEYLERDGSVVVDVSRVRFALTSCSCSDN